MIKRLLDIGFSTMALVLLAPLMVLIALLVALDPPGGAFFRQVRVGRNGRTFRMLKFRTMRPQSESAGLITVGARDPRVTGIGQVLRRTKLDELPQLLNVLLGDMSLVGPRPEVPHYVAMYTEEQRRVLSVRPGITGMASLMYFQESELLGRSSDQQRTYVEEVMPAKLALELEYVKHASTTFDLKLLWLTAARLLMPKSTAERG
jgi:lipopolysaccharide/colanic/teichoic acid biosynthesis glycosyltransferase